MFSKVWCALISFTCARGCSREWKNSIFLEVYLGVQLHCASVVTSRKIKCGLINDVRLSEPLSEFLPCNMVI